MATEIVRECRSTIAQRAVFQLDSCMWRSGIARELVTEECAVVAAQGYVGFARAVMPPRST